MAERVRNLESNNNCSVTIGSYSDLSRGLRAWHVKKVGVVNVGGPGCPSRIGVLADKCKSEGAETVARKSDEAWYRRSRVMSVDGKASG